MSGSLLWQRSGRFQRRLELHFYFKRRVKWHDGKPLTVEDVKFSFDAIMDKENRWKTAHSKPYYENIGEVKILDKKES